ncbi:MAG: glycosyltransferase [Candidatus Hodarchaeota archaeon]
MSEFFILISLIFLSTMMLYFFFYGIIIIFANIRGEKPPQADSELAREIIEEGVTVIIPTHNEEKIIASKIDNLLQACKGFSKFEILVIDDSEDNTRVIIEDIRQKYHQIRLIEMDKREGYNNAMIRGISNARFEYLIITDSSSYFDKDTIKNMLKRIKQDNVGCVTGKGIVINQQKQGASLEHLYLSLQNFQRNGESIIDSTFHSRGEISMFKKSLISDISSIKGIFDIFCAFHIRKKGFKIKYYPDIVYYENATSSKSELVQQKTTRATNLLKTIFENKGFLLNPKYGYFGLIIYPFNFLMLFITPFLLLFSQISFFLFLVENWINLILYEFELVFIVSSFTIILLIIPKIRLAIILMLAIQYSLLVAVFRLVFKRNKDFDKIDQIPSTRENFNTE